jgi:YggT family protein
VIALVLVTFIDLFVTVFNLLLIVRVISSYVVRPGSRFYTGLVNLTEPLVGPVRRILPQFPGLDLGPLATFFLLQGLQYLIHWLIGA